MDNVYPPDSLELFRAAGDVILSADELLYGAYLVALARRVDVAHGHRRANAARDAVQKGPEIAHLAVVHHHEFGIFVDRPVAIKVDLFGCLRLVLGHHFPFH